jgi:hypothetical protein
MKNGGISRKENCRLTNHKNLQKGTREAKNITSTKNVKFCGGTQILGLGNHLDFHHNRSCFPNMHLEPLM